MKPVVRKLATWLLAALLLCALAATLVGVAFWFTLRAAPGEWSEHVSLGPLQAELGVLPMIRVAMHPLGMRALSGRTWNAPIGRLSFLADDEGDALRVVCDPCMVDAPALSRERLRLPHVEWTVLRSGANDLHGDMSIGALRSAWHARLRARDLDLDLTIAGAPIADVYAVFRDAIPELARAHIDGRVSADIHLALPSRRVTVKPRLEGYAVSGLGSEALLGATPLPACARPTRRADAAAPFGAWLPKAVVAAEDQRFFEHAGYDLAEMTAAWTAEPGRADAPRGASTLSQQLAKLLYTGDERTLARKLRELLYAVELDRTLGKARVLTLYLSIAPWGEGLCGAQAAALHHFGKRASALTPIEAAWLASLLRNPDAELRRAAQSQAPDLPRMRAILAGMRPLPRSRREALGEELQEWKPPVSPATQ